MTKLSMFKKYLKEYTKEYNIFQFMEWVTIQLPDRKPTKIVLGGTRKTMYRSYKEAFDKCNMADPDHFNRPETLSGVPGYEAPFYIYKDEVNGVDWATVSWYADYPPLTNMGIVQQQVAKAACCAIHECMELVCVDYFVQKHPGFTLKNDKDSRNVLLKYLNADPWWPHDKTVANVELKLTFHDKPFDPHVVGF